MEKDVLHSSVQREKKMYIIGGTISVDLDDISLILPPTKKETEWSFKIFLKTGAVVETPPSEEAFAFWLGLTEACTKGTVKFVGSAMGVDEVMFSEFQRVEDKIETYPYRKIP